MKLIKLEHFVINPAFIAWAERVPEEESLTIHFGVPETRSITTGSYGDKTTTHTPEHGKLELIGSEAELVWKELNAV